MKVCFASHAKAHAHHAPQALSAYTFNADSAPRQQWLEIAGPGCALRLLREGSPDFSSFSELAKSLVQPGMSEHERAMAVYRFCARNFHNASMGWGDTEMTQFINCFGYSFCWGQADFQHLLYEAAGLRARAPQLVGHSSTEVFLDGRWRMMEAYMRLLVPAPDLAGLAGGDQLHLHPQMFDAVATTQRAKVCREYWSQYAPGGSYEPQADSAAMRFDLRRGEAVRFDLNRRECWGLAPWEPADYCNGQWHWAPVLDQTHLADEVECSVNAIAVEDGIAADDSSAPVSMDYRVKSPWPMLRGRIGLCFSEAAAVRLEIFDPAKHIWIVLHDGADAKVDVRLDDHLSSAMVPPSCNMHQRKRERDIVRECVFRVSWRQPAVCKSIDFDFTLQAHRPGFPALEAGLNQWTLLAEAAGATVRHGWTEYGGWSVSDFKPYEGQVVRLGVAVRNRTNQPVLNVPVRFVQAGSGTVLGTTTVARINPGSSADASIEWVAAIHGDRPPVSDTQPKRYLSTVVRAEIGDANNLAGDCPVYSETELVVRVCRPPRFNQDLVWSGPGVDSDTAVLRAAVVHGFAGEACGEVLYLQDGVCSVSLQPFDGDPDQGGAPMAESRRLEKISVSEFGVAEWSLSRDRIPPDGAVWILMEPDAPFKGRTVVQHRFYSHGAPNGASR